MGHVRIKKLKPGMVIAEDVRDIKGRLLLAKGKPIGPEHIRIFKIWGIPQVDIKGAPDEGEKSPQPHLDPAWLDQVRAETEKLFCHTDRQNPVIQELFTHAVSYRAGQSSPDAAGHEPPRPEAPPAEDPRHRAPDFLEKFIEREISLPEIPSIVFELNEVIANPLSTADQMAQVINKSPSLTALLLKIVNSSFYGLPSRVDRVSLAVTLIGTRELSALALGISIISMFRSIPSNLLSMRSFLYHSLACGIVSRLLSAQRVMRQTEQMFTAGLLHDLGRLVVYLYFPEDALAVLQHGLHSGSCLYTVEKRLLGCNHAYLGKYLLNRWHLPLVLENAVFFHHGPSDAPDPLPAAIVHVADIVVNALGTGSSGERFVPPLSPGAWEALDLQPSCLEVIVHQTINQLNTLDFLMQGPSL